MTITLEFAKSLPLRQEQGKEYVWGNLGELLGSFPDEHVGEVTGDQIRGPSGELVGEEAGYLVYRDRRTGEKYAVRGHVFVGCSG